MTEHRFPNPERADHHGLLAHSDSIDAGLVFSAHSEGVFPWYDSGDPILWWSPDPRGIIPTDGVHVSRSLRKQLRTMPYHLTLDTAFGRVIDYCANVHGESWITADIRRCYTELYRQGRAHSCELWHGDSLIGGMYGVGLERIFCGESMFSLRPSASKIVLARLCQYLARLGIDTLDTQFLTPHLISMGGIHIPRCDYLARLTDNPDAHRGRWQWQEP